MLNHRSPKVWHGCLDFSGTLNEYNYSDSEEQSDTRAMISDWENVGLDIKTAMEQFDKENYGRVNP